VRIGTSYNVRLYAQSFFNTSSTYTAVSTTTPVKDTTAPSIPTGFTAVVGTGRAVSLDWNDNTEPDFSEYGIYRRTTAVTPETSITSKIAEVRASRFVDTDVDIGTTYYYWLNAYDSVENVSTFAPYVQATPSSVAASATDSTPPDTPAAFSMSLTQPGAYLSDDGTTLTRLNVSLPPMPTLGTSLHLLYKLQSGTQYSVAGIYTVGSIDAMIDDLSPGKYYTIAVQAFSAFDIGSTVRVVTGTDALAPVNATAPGVPSAFTHVAGNNSAYARPPSMLGTLVGFSCRHNWTAPTDKDLVGYEWTTLGATGSDPVGNGNFSPINEAISVLSGPVTSYLYVRSKNRSGVFSTWVTDSVNLNTSHLQPAGDMMLEVTSDVTVTGITQGAGSLQRKVVARQPVYKQINLTGGAASETYSLDITNWGFSTAPDVGWFQSADQGGMLIRYDYDSSSSTVAELRITMADGSNVPTWTNMEITGELAEYT
jgi:hypothetical protein